MIWLLKTLFPSLAQQAKDKQLALMPEHIRTMANAIRYEDKEKSKNPQYIKGMADGMDTTAEHVEKMRI